MSVLVRAGMGILARNNTQSVRVTRISAKIGKIPATGLDDNYRTNSRLNKKYCINTTIRVHILAVVYVFYLRVLTPRMT